MIMGLEMYGFGPKTFNNSKKKKKKLSNDTFSKTKSIHVSYAD